MSQPPGPYGPYQQQPGQGGYPQQPGPGGHGQQGGPGGYGQQAGYPQQGHGPPQGQTSGQYPPQGPPPGGYPPGGYPPGAPQRKKSPLPWILGGVGGLVVLGGVAVLLILMFGSSTGTAQGTAEQFEAAFNDRDRDEIQQLVCVDVQQKFADEVRADFFAEIPDGARIELDRLDEEGTTATAHYKRFVRAEEMPPWRIELVERDGTWEICE